MLPLIDSHAPLELVADVETVLHALAMLKGLDPAETAARTTENARSLFRLP